MILPSKHLSQDRALLTTGARILSCLDQQMTVSALWEEISNDKPKNTDSVSILSYDGFILALDLLFLLGAIDLKEGLLARRTS